MLYGNRVPVMLYSSLYKQGALLYAKRSGVVMILRLQEPVSLCFCWPELACSVSKDAGTSAEHIQALIDAMLEPHGGNVLLV